MNSTEFNFLKDLQHTLKTQNKDMQAHPRFWVIKDYRYEPCPSEHADRSAIYLPSHDHVYPVHEIYSTLIEINKHDMDELFTAEEFQDVLHHIQNEDLEEINEWIQEHVDKDSRVIHEILVDHIVPNTLFITKDDAINHLRSNQHHYTERAHTYAMTAWRSPSIHQLWDILEHTDWDEYTQTRTDELEPYSLLKHIDPELDELIDTLRFESLGRGNEATQDIHKYIHENYLKIDKTNE